MDNLEDYAYLDCEKNREKVLVAMHHSRVDPETEDRNILGFSRGTIRLMVATIGFGMGIDVSNVRQVFLYGAPANEVDAIQMLGRAGRDGMPARGFIFPRVMSKIDPSFQEMMKALKEGKERCLRRCLLRAIGVAVATSTPQPMCCTLCDRDI